MGVMFVVGYVQGVVGCFQGNFVVLYFVVGVQYQCLVLLDVGYDVVGSEYWVGWVQLLGFVVYFGVDDGMVWCVYVGYQQVLDYVVVVDQGWFGFDFGGFEYGGEEDCQVFVVVVVIVFDFCQGEGYVVVFVGVLVVQVVVGVVDVLYQVGDLFVGWFVFYCGDGCCGVFGQFCGEDFVVVCGEWVEVVLQVQ